MRARWITIAPGGGKTTIAVAFWIHVCIRPGRTPKLGFIRWLISNGASIPSDAMQDEGEFA